MAWYDRGGQDQRREEERRYEGDVVYEVWRGGGNSDAVDYDRARDAHHDGVRSDDHASALLREQAGRRQAHRDEDARMGEAEYYAAQDAAYAEDQAIAEADAAAPSPAPLARKDG